MAGRPKNEDVPVKYTVSTPKMIMYVGSGVALDAFDFVLGITGVGEIADEVVDLIADVTLPPMAYVLGIPLGGRKSGKKVQTILIAEVAKIVPFVNIIPLYTWETWRLIELSREEDREKAKEQAANDEQAQAIQMQRQVRAYQVVMTQQQLAQQAANDREEQEDVQAAA